MADLMKERLMALLERKHEELSALDAERKRLYNAISELESILSITEGEAVSSHLTLKANKALKRGGKFKWWTPEEDKVIIDYIREHPKSRTPDVCRALTDKLSRPPFGIRGRIETLLKNKTLKAHQTSATSAKKLEVA